MCMCVCALYSYLVLVEATVFPGSGVTCGCELLYGCSESNTGPLEELLVLLTADHLISLALKSCF